MRLSNGIDSAKNNKIIEVISSDSSPNSPPPRIKSVIGLASITIPTAAGIVKNNILCIVFCIFLVKSSLLSLLIAAFRFGNTAVAKAIPNRLTAKLWMFLAKLKAASPPSIILIPTIAKTYRFNCHAMRPIDLGIISFIIFLNPGCFTFNSGLYLYLVVNRSISLIIKWRLAPIKTPIAALYIPNLSFKKITPAIIPKLYKTGEIANEKKCRYVISIFPSVLLIAKRNADGSINLVINMMSACPSGATAGNTAGIILSINMNATTLKTAINMLAPESIVFARDLASFSSLCRYSENIGINAAVRAPAINRLNSMSGIRNEAL